MRHPLHCRGSHHDRHGNLEAEDSGRQVDAGDIDEDSGPEPSQNTAAQRPVKNSSIAPAAQARKNDCSDHPRRAAAEVAPYSGKCISVLLEGPLVLGPRGVVVVDHLRQLLPGHLLVLGDIDDLRRHGDGIGRAAHSRVDGAVAGLRQSGGQAEEALQQRLQASQQRKKMRGRWSWITHEQHSFTSGPGNPSQGLVSDTASNVVWLMVVTSH